MTNDKPTKAGFTYGYATQGKAETANLNLEALQEAMREIRERFDDDIRRPIRFTGSHLT